jgi:hypothetical protein
MNLDDDDISRSNLFQHSILPIVYLYESKKTTQFASSQKLDYTGIAHADSYLNIMQIISWENISLNSVLNRMSDNESIDNGELFTWERAFDSFIFFVAKIYPGKVRMLHAYKLEMRTIWLQLSIQLSWSEFLTLEKRLREKCTRRFNTVWSQSRDPTWSTSILQALHSHPHRSIEESWVTRRYKQRDDKGKDERVKDRDEKGRDQEAKRKREDGVQICFNYNDELSCPQSCQRIHACIACGKTNCRFASCKMNPKHIACREFQRMKRDKM